VPAHLHGEQAACTASDSGRQHQLEQLVISEGVIRVTDKIARHNAGRTFESATTTNHTPSDRTSAVAACQHFELAWHDRFNIEITVDPREVDSTGFPTLLPPHGHHRIEVRDTGRHLQRPFALHVRQWIKRKNQTLGTGPYDTGGVADGFGLAVFIINLSHQWFCSVQP
jgi:hypothetical protein